MNIDELLEAERRRAGFSKEERTSMWQGIERSLGVGAPRAAANVPDANEVGAKVPTTNGAARGVRLASWKLGALLSLAAIGGGAMGAAGHARWGEPKIVRVEHAVLPAPVATTTPSPSIETPRPADATPVPLTAPSRSVLRARSNPEPARSVHVSSSTTPSVSPKDPSLARERTLLDMARTALSRGDASGALVSLDTHAREFPSSQLAEEREVLAIQALAATNRLAEARRRGAAFRATYPASPLLRIVDEATQ